MASDLQKRKLRTYFRRYDANADGFLTRDDYRIIADRATDDKLSRREKTREDYTKIFDALYAIAGEDGKIDEKIFIEAGAKMLTDPQFRKALDDAIRTAFGLLDTSGNGYIQEEKYIRFLNDLQFRDHEYLAKLAFKGLDSNKDGVLSFEEFRDACYDFWFSEDETRPGTLLWGPLVEE